MSPEVIFLLAVVHVLCACFCAFVAGEKGRNQTNWSLLGLFCGLIALIAVCGVPAKSAEHIAAANADFAATEEKRRAAVKSTARGLGQAVGKMMRK